MVKTRTELKAKLKEWIINRDEPFTTEEVKQELKKYTNYISLSSNRLQNYIRATSTADYDKKREKWNIRLKPLKKCEKIEKK